LLVLSNNHSAIHLYNPGITEAHAFIFGGSEYTEPIVAQGPFVMNSRCEIVQAFNDFFEGRYGAITMNANDFA
jgi:redox-sensitive bicupin YhaK (pirin superfamily)